MQIGIDMWYMWTYGSHNLQIFQQLLKHWRQKRFKIERFFYSVPFTGEEVPVAECCKFKSQGSCNKSQSEGREKINKETQKICSSTSSFANKPKKAIFTLYKQPLATTWSPVLVMVRGFHPGSPVFSYLPITSGIGTPFPQFKFLWCFHNSRVV